MTESKLHRAIIEVTKEVKSIDKDMTIGKGQNAYKGVADKDVKQKIGQSMAKNGLTCLMVKIEPTMRIDRWEEDDTYNKQPPYPKKTKQSVFTEVLATFRITHAETDEHIEVMGYGHGVDPQDKSAGKATTYALKNALLYTFLVPTGAIDDTDTDHSNDHEPPPKKLPPCNDELFGKYCQYILDGTLDGNKIVITEAYLRERHTLTPEQEQELANV